MKVVRSLPTLAALMLVLVVVALVGPRLASGTPVTAQPQAYVQVSEMEALKREVASLEKRFAALEQKVATHTHPSSNSNSLGSANKSNNSSGNNSSSSGNNNVK